jgi:two-component system LytT family response regulator
MTAPSRGDRVRVLVIDDEPLSRQVLCALLAPLDDFVVVGECRDGNEALEAIEMLAPTLAFLDVQMPHRNGIELVHAIHALTLEQPLALVFVTAFDEFAVRAFEADAIDYLIKPFTDDRFHTTIARVRRFFEREDVFARYSKPPQERIVVSVGDRSVVVPVDAIDWVSADGYYSRLHVGQTSYLVRSSLGALEQRLGAERFVRAHRGALVRLDRIREVKRTTTRGCELVLVSGARIVVSERRRSELTERLDAKD